MRTAPLVAFILLVSCGPALAEPPNAAAIRAQAGAEARFPHAALDGMFEGEFFYADDREPGRFAVALQADGPGRWKGMVRDQGGPQAQVVATWDGLLFLMSKQYPANRPVNYAEWVSYVGTIKHDAATGDLVAIGTWSIPGDPRAWGFFVINFKK